MDGRKIAVDHRSLVAAIMVGACLMSGCATSGLWATKDANLSESAQAIQDSDIYYNKETGAICIPYRLPRRLYTEVGSLFVEPKPERINLQRMFKRDVDAETILKAIQIRGDYRLNMSFSGGDEGIRQLPNTEEEEIFVLTAVIPFKDDSERIFGAAPGTEIEFRVRKERGRIKHVNSGCQSDEWGLSFDKMQHVQLSMTESELDYEYRHSALLRVVLSPFAVVYDIVTLPFIPIVMIVAAGP